MSRRCPHEIKELFLKEKNELSVRCHVCKYELFKHNPVDLFLLVCQIITKQKTPSNTYIKKELYKLLKIKSETSPYILTDNHEIFLISFHRSLLTDKPVEQIIEYYLNQAIRIDKHKYFFIEEEDELIAIIIFRYQKQQITRLNQKSIQLDENYSLKR